MSEPDRGKFPIPQTFDAAKNHKINFGKYKGLTINQIAAEGDSGLSYLAWLYDNISDKFEDTAAALDLFVAHPQVLADMKAMEAAQKNGRR